MVSTDTKGGIAPRLKDLVFLMDRVFQDKIRKENLNLMPYLQKGKLKSEKWLQVSDFLY